VLLSSNLPVIWCFSKSVLLARKPNIAEPVIYWDNLQKTTLLKTCDILKYHKYPEIQIRRCNHKNLNSPKTRIILPEHSFAKTTCILRVSVFCQNYRYANISQLFQIVDCKWQIYKKSSHRKLWTTCLLPQFRIYPKLYWISSSNIIRPLYLVFHNQLDRHFKILQNFCKPDKIPIIYS